MLPRHIANQLKDGKSVQAGQSHLSPQLSVSVYLSVALSKCPSFSGEFEACTILFSDVVTFTNICAACEPIDIVHMLNRMYSKFDRLTNVHDIYKVLTLMLSSSQEVYDGYCGAWNKYLWMRLLKTIIFKQGNYCVEAEMHFVLNEVVAAITVQNSFHHLPLVLIQTFPCIVFILWSKMDLNPA